MITGMDRLLAAVNGKKSDRVPVFCNLFDQGALELGVSLEEYYKRGELVAEAQIKMQARYGYDNVWSLFYVGKEAELMGCKEILFAKDGPPNVKDFVIKEFKDIETLVIPEDLTLHPAFEEQAKCLKILKRELGGKYPICAYLTGSMTLPVLLMGMEKWMELLFWGPPELKNLLLEKTSDFFRKEIAAFRKLGADILLYSNPFGSMDVIPEPFFHQESMTWMKRDLEPGGMAGVVYYCGMARLNGAIPSVIKELGIGTYYLSPFDDLKEGIELVGPQRLSCGVINDIPLIDWSKEEIRSEVKRMMEIGRRTPRFLFGTGVMPLYIPQENILTMLEAAYEYGKF